MAKKKKDKIIDLLKQQIIPIAFVATFILIMVLVINFNSEPTPQELVQDIVNPSNETVELSEPPLNLSNYADNNWTGTECINVKLTYIDYNYWLNENETDYARNPDGSLAVEHDTQKVTFPETQCLTKNVYVECEGGVFGEPKECPTSCGDVDLPMYYYTEVDGEKVRKDSYEIQDNMSITLGRCKNVY